MMVESPITITQLAGLVVTGATSGRSNAPPMAIAAGLLLAHDISDNPTTLLVTVFVVVEPTFTTRVAALAVRAYFDANLVIALELAVYFVRFSTVVMVFRVGHDSLQGYESTLSRDKQLNRRATVLARAVFKTERTAGVQFSTKF